MMTEPIAPAHRDLDPDPKALRRENRRFVRRYLRVSGWMLGFLCIANLALFRQDGVDLVFGLAALACVLCLFYTRFERYMQPLWWHWTLMSLPFWPLALLMALHLVMGTYAHFNAPPVPDSVRRAPLRPGQAEAYITLITKYSGAVEDMEDYDLGEALETLHTYYRKLRHADSPAPLTDVLDDPDFADALEIATPYLDEYLDFRAANSPAPAQILRPNEPSPHELRRKTALAECLRIAHLAHTGQTEEARRLYRRLLQGVEQGLMPGNTMTGYALEIPLLMTVTREQAELAPEILAGHEAEFREIVARCQARLETVEQAMIAAEFDWFESYINRKSYGGMLTLGELLEDAEPQQMPAIIAATPLRDLKLRLNHWPFRVRRDTIGGYGQRLHAILQTRALPAREAHEWLVKEQKEREVKGAWAYTLKYLQPNPSGRILLGIPSYERAFTRVRGVKSCLAAYDAALAWRTGAEPSQLPPDPMTQRPFLTIITPHPSSTFSSAILRAAPETPVLDRLVIGGGDPTLLKPLANMETPLAQHGLSGRCLYVITTTRPAAPMKFQDR